MIHDADTDSRTEMFISLQRPSQAFLDTHMRLGVSLMPSKCYIRALYRRSSGIGAVVSPLVCQSVLATGVPWPHFYFGSLVVSAINTSLLFYAFKPTLNEFLTERKAALDSVIPHVLTRKSESRSAGASADYIPSDEKGQTPSTSIVHVDAPAPVSSE